MYEDEKFPSRELAALVASKVYYHLGEFDDSVTFALGAGKLFDIESADRSEYVDTIICKFQQISTLTLFLAKCIDKYALLRVQEYENPSAGVVIDARLKDVTERMFKRCFDDKEYKQAIGIALEARRLDIMEAAIQKGNPTELAKYTLDVTMTLIQNLDFRNNILRSLVTIFKNLKEPDFIAISQCLVWLNDPASMADMILHLVKNDDVTTFFLQYLLNDLETFAYCLSNCIRYLRKCHARISF